ncbi:hypothetical protein F5J12DRAFT_454734 [Pisolithus orientalis]|uniref:uncharacterized protein n=1 Tax=Pisolithus orientalis TaxID=936130 RepID=UPI0022241040|nr:uncharacterized protein F5J12DRAFT_454734 [Pisolithus orientalis]KAI6025922.1 hypothetical protein F5J12DRAFT_454734 [Pisolithus orientalis]
MSATTATTTTATETIRMLSESDGVLPLKADSSDGSLSSTDVNLQSLYNPAARAFLHHDHVVAENLIASAFTILRPPIVPAPDSLDSHRRKWDILRITLETTAYTTPSDRDALPPALRETLMLSPQLFVNTAHARSLSLFTPSSLPRRPSSAFLPHQVLITLAASSLKVNCPAVGREIVEDWLGNRGQYDYIPSTREAYEKVLELYCLYILPALQEWEYSKEFLQFEIELPHEKRIEFQKNIENLQERAGKGLPALTPACSTSSLRPSSPTPSSSSSSSSMSTLSTRTVTPMSRLSSAQSKPRTPSTTSVASAASDATVKRRPFEQHQRGHTPPVRASPSASLVRKARTSTSVVETSEPPNLLALIRAYLYRCFTVNRFTALSVLFLLLPVLSYLIRLRRTRGSNLPASTTDQVKRRLLDSRNDSFVRRMWDEIVKAVIDTVRMGGSGLV